MIGDVLASSIMFEALRQKFPKTQLDYLINEHTYPVVENNPFIDNFIFFTKKEETNKKALYKLALKLRKQKYDVVIDVYSKFSSNLISALSGAKIKISKYKWYTSFIYSHTFKESKIPKTIAGLAIENRLELLKPILNKTPVIIQPKIYLTSEELKNAKHYLEENNVNLSKQLYMISVLGSGMNKTYPFDFMATLIDDIVAITNAQILFNYIPNQIKEAQAIYNLCKPETQNHIKFDVFGKSLREFMAITKHCNALIGNEGGAINMAKALDIPTFTIFSPWIVKVAWNMFDDEKNHVSVHLNDVKPELYTGKNRKEVKKNYKSYYEAFTPDLILDKLKAFLED